MEEKVSLALAVKLKRIFEKTPDQFLSFPLGLGFSYVELDFMKEGNFSAEELRQQLQSKAHFAHLINQMPTDGTPVFSPSGRYLWNEVKGVLTDATFAATTLSSEEERRLAEAIDFLTDEKAEPDGTTIPVASDKLRAYTKYKILDSEAQEAYLAEKLMVENATGEEGQALKAAWAGGREQQWRRLVDQARQDWITLGFKNQIEAFQVVRNALEVKKYPILYRQEYVNEINLAESPDLAANGIPFYLTFYNPVNAFDRTLPWQELDLLKSEIDSLVNQASPELRGVFSSSRGNEDIESLSLEYSYIGVMRPWFRPEFFNSRYWKMPDGSLVSDGGIPRQGRIPAYITGMLVVRNITMTRKKGAAGQGNILPLVDRAPLQRVQVTRGSLVPHVAAPTIKPAVSLQAAAARLTALPHQPAPQIIHDRAGMAAARRSTFVISDVRDHRALQKLYLTRKYEGTTVSRPSPATPKIGKPVLVLPPAVAADTLTETLNLDGVAVLAFVCQRLPKSPNPDPNAQW